MPGPMIALIEYHLSMIEDKVCCKRGVAHFIYVS